MKIIHCNGKVDEQDCNKAYAIVSKVVARKKQSIFYPFDEARWKLAGGTPHTKCSKCGKPLKGQIPIEVFYE